MHTASPLYTPPSHPGSHYYAMAHHRYATQWDSSSDPRQPRRTIKEEARPCSRPHEQPQYIPVKPEPGSTPSFNDGWQFGHPDMSQQGGGYELIGNDQFWYHPGNAARQEYDARSSGNAATAQAPSNYAMYGSSRTSNIPVQEAGFGQHAPSVYASHAQYGDGRQHPRGGASPQHARKSQLDGHSTAAAGPWGSEVADKGTIAAQQCMNSLFPEIVGVYSPAGEPNDPIFGRGPTSGDGASTYYDSPDRTDRHQSSRSRGISLATRDPYHRHHHSDHIHSGPVHSPALDGLPFTPSPQYSKAVFDSYSDASDSDSDSAYPHMMMRNSSSPHSSVDTAGTGTPMTSKYPSPEIMDSGAFRQHQYANDGPSPPRHSPASPQAKNIIRPRSDTDMPPPETLKLITLGPEAFDRNDAWLVHYRNQSVPYKNIKLMLGLDEAESTLRGRYRTLIKPKSQRLRRPPWTEKDKELLLSAVNPDLPNIKWKQVSEHIYANGGSYLFGSSTCKKQYNQLVADGRAKPLSESAGATKRVKQESDSGYQQQPSQQQHHHHYYPAARSS